SMSTDYRGGDPGYVAGSHTSISSAHSTKPSAKLIERRFAHELVISMEEADADKKGLAAFELHARARLLPRQKESPRIRSLVLRDLAYDSGLLRQNPATGKYQVVWFANVDKIKKAFPGICEVSQ